MYSSSLNIFLIFDKLTSCYEEKKIKSYTTEVVLSIYQTTEGGERNLIF